MKKTLSLILACCCAALAGFAQDYSTLWQPVTSHTLPSKGVQVLKPSASFICSVNEQSLSDLLTTLPSNAGSAPVVELPMPDGTMRPFRVWQTPVMPDALAAKYPGITTFTAFAVGNQSVTAKIDYTPFGFHAMIFDGASSVMIDPYSNVADGYYQSYYKRDYTRPVNQRMVCGVKDDNHIINGRAEVNLTDDGLPQLAYRLNGVQHKTYRLALACTGEYAMAVAGPTPTKAAVLAKMVTSVNRVNGVYEKELAVTMTLIPAEDTLIFLDSAADPYANANGGTMLGQNQTTVTNRIGSANYDFGHVFSTGGGGIATLGCVCKSNSKAQGVTGLPNPVGDSYDIDYVAHEMGHEFGANHPFNDNTNGSCSGNAVQSHAYEPGSGSTIMAYAGICTGDDYQYHSNTYFHSTSLEEINTYITNTTNGGGVCPVVTTSPNTNAAVPAFSAVYSIPYKTPFELTAPLVTDNTADSIRFCWEERDLGDFGKTFANTHLKGPIFRSFDPDSSRTRVFPALAKLLAGTTSAGEKLPDTARVLRFKLTERDVYQGLGCFNFPDDTIHLDVINTGRPFTVTAPGTATTSWAGNTKQIVTWDVAGTDTDAVHCATVSIYMSADGGYTWPYLLDATTPNDGVDTIMVPNVAIAKARIKVKGDGNVFFNINAANFAVQKSSVGITPVLQPDQISVSPMPVRGSIVIRIQAAGSYTGKIISTVGQAIWSGSCGQSTTIPVQNWARGVYYLQLSGNGGTPVSRSLVLE